MQFSKVYTFFFKMSATIILLTLLLFNFNLIAQERITSKVMNEDGSELGYPWAGGMNSIQFGEIDLNRDGMKDLLAFDRHGNRKMCFINYGVYDKISYLYAPEYAGLLPELSAWAIFKDYDGDGRVDIFTYSPGWAGMKVYRNISQNILKFELVVFPYLTSYQFGGHVNLFVTDVDYPGIVDIDFDGDLDILSFWGLGSFVNFHKNLSMEKYGHADSLDYELVELCWGRFAESEESNKIYLDTCFEQSVANKNNLKVRHTGSTFLLLDLDQDTVLDLLLGDVDFPGIFSLSNGGSKDEAFIASYDTNFPAYGTKIDLFSFPAAAYIDVNNDGTKDLLVSPFDPWTEASENKHSVWLYKNTGANNKPFFYFQGKDFLQSEMIDQGSGAYPTLFDWDKDGLLDLFIGNYGFYRYSYYEHGFLRSVYRSKVAYYKNTGTHTNPQFQLMNSDFGGFSKLDLTGIVPSFGDLDDDGDTDVIIGTENGDVLYFTNIDGGGFLQSNKQFPQIDVGDYSAPQLFDLDKDGLQDLIIGEEDGNLNYYRNTGSLSNPIFESITDSLGKVNVTDYNLSYTGYSVPWFFRLPSGETQLLVGSEKGDIFYFINIDGNLEGKFTESDDLDQLLDTSGVSFDRGMRTAAAIAEISKNGKLEMIAGNFSGGLEYFNGSPEVSPGFSEDQAYNSGNIKLFPNPAKTNVTLIFNEDVKDVKLEVINSKGQSVLAQEIAHTTVRQIELDISNLQNGLYFIKSISHKGIQTGKLIIYR